jgi:hypothetical protein
MQVVGLPGHVIRSGSGAALASAETGARPALDLGAGRGGGGLARRQPDVGQAQASWGRSCVWLGMRSPTPPSGASSALWSGLGMPSPFRFFAGRPAPRPGEARSRRRWAKRLGSALKARRPGEAVQGDTLSLSFGSGHAVKQFTAVDPFRAGASAWPPGVPPPPPPRFVGRSFYWKAR